MTATSARGGRAAPERRSGVDGATGPSGERADEPSSGRDDPSFGAWHLPAVLAAAAVIVVGIIFRFLTRSPLWLDEALSVNIAKLPLAEIPQALRHDGHPPLYYFMLHGWMRLFGESDVAVRALSGVFGLALLPLTFLAGRRLGGNRVAWTATVLMAISPFAIRYSTETRMYAMVMAFSVAGWLVGRDALRRPTMARFAGVAVLTALLLLSHYWSLWLLAAVGVGLVAITVQAHRRDRTADRTASLAVLAAMAVGAVPFLVWVPSLLYQGAHTGTPWASPVRPTEIIARSLADFGGGPKAEAILFGWFLAIFALLGLFGRRVGPHRIELDLATRPAPRPLVLLIAGTLVIASLAGYATSSTYATRYAAVFFPFVILLAALGVSLIDRGLILLGVMAVLVALGTVGGVRNVVEDRSQSAVTAHVIEANGQPGDYVAYCPDQLGPAASRVLRGGFRQVTYPAFARPERVDWVDYVERLDRQTPDRFAAELVRRAGSHRIFLVWESYARTHTRRCTDLVNALLRLRPNGRLMSETQGSLFFEPSSVHQYDPAPPIAP